MYSLYRRHLKTCPYRAKGRAWKRCKCPVWVDGVESGIDRRESLKTNSWEQAEDKLREIRSSPHGRLSQAKTVEEASGVYLADVAKRVAAGTLRKQRALVKQFVAFARERGRVYLKQFSFEDALAFRGSWQDAPLSASKKLERFRSMFRFFASLGWCENVAKDVKRPVVKQVPTLPFTVDEMTMILAAAGDIQKKHRVPAANAERLAALVLVLRYTGLRIVDAVKLAPQQVAEGRVFLYQEKTGEPVWVPVPSAVTEALERVSKRSTGHYFWTGESSGETIAGNWRRGLRRVFGLAGIANGHPHRFRDTFAVEFLNAGNSLESLQRLLGHASIKTTERHYAPWVRTRQKRLENEVRATWESDKILKSLESTRKVHALKK